jgi:hypothetical protein
MNYVDSTGIDIKFVCSVSVGAVCDFQRENPAKCVSTIHQKTADANSSTDSSTVT